jgi:hypothetical protein
MKYIRPLLVLVFLFIIGRVSAQISEFNLSDYKLPDLNYREFVTNFNFGGNNNSYLLSESSSTSKTRNYSFSGDFSAYYYHYLNNATRQKEESAGFDFSPNFNSTKDDGDLTDRSNSLNPSVYYLATNRIYRDKRFIEVDLDIDYKLLKYNIRQTLNLYPVETIVDERPVYHDFSVTIPLKIGTGRIEQVQDARQAVYIFDELSKIDRVGKERSKEEVLEFAQFISELKKERFFDSRLKRMAELEALDSFLVAHNYLLKSDARYFTTLLDFWEYGGASPRNSGNRLSFSLYPGYSFYYYKNTGNGWYYNSGKRSYYALSISGGIEYKHEKPINLYWQNTIDINGYFGVTEVHDTTRSGKSTASIPNMQIGYFQTIAYYPNTRTNIQLTGSLQYMYLFGKNDPENFDFHGYGARTSVTCSANYYITQKLRLSLYSSLYYILQDSDDEVPMNFNDFTGSAFTLSDYKSYVNSPSSYMKNHFSGVINVGLTYSIF